MTEARSDGAVPDYHPPLKRSMTIAGHQTSISLEPMFWTALEAEARRQGLPLNALVARVDAARLHAKRPPNLTSALRQYLFAVLGESVRGEVTDCRY